MSEEQKKEMSQSEIGKLAVEIWKLEKRLKKIDNLSDDDVKATSFLLNRMYKIIEGYDVQLLDYTGQKFLEGMAGIDILSAETDKDIDFPIIGEVMTPLVIIGGKIDQRSKVVIKTPENVVDEVQTKELDKQYKQFAHKNNSSLILKIIGLLLILLSLIGITRFIGGKLLQGTTEESWEDTIIEAENDEVNDENNTVEESIETEIIEEQLENVVEDEINLEKNSEDGIINEIQNNENSEEQNIEQSNDELE